ncbi:hypothetical protein FACS1894214_2410 [Planctomycetales bacterium]|nr:hypothetical protein FACS1894214_2410 [Planctomycetales bacterium]
MKQCQCIGIIVFLFIFVFVSGCGGPKYKFAVNKVEGVVTLDGVPFDGVTITFMPNSTGEMGFARTGNSGEYQLSALGAKPQGGTTEGEYCVSFDKSMLASDSGDKMKQYVPKKYLTPETSGFKVKVEKGKNIFNFDLKSK